MTGGPVDEPERVPVDDAVSVAVPIALALDDAVTLALVPVLTLLITVPVALVLDDAKACQPRTRKARLSSASSTRRYRLRFRRQT